MIVKEDLFDILDLLNEAPPSVLGNELSYFSHELDTEFPCLFLMHLSDPHYGNPFSAIELFLHSVSLLDKVANLYAVFGGDLCESSTKTSKGEIYRQVGSPQDQRDFMIDKLYPYRHKILGFTDGNHEKRIYNEVGIDITKDIAKACGVPYRENGLYLKISFGDGNNRTKGKPYVYWDYSTHGYGGARTKSAKAVKVERLSGWLMADLYAMSHDHVVNVAPDIFLMPDNRTHIDKETGFDMGKVSAKRKMLLKTNAFLKWGGYSEIGGFPPVDLCTPVVKFAGSGKPRVNIGV